MNDYLTDRYETTRAPVPGEIIWAICYPVKRNKNGRIYNVYNKIEKRQVRISDVTFLRCYEDRDDVEGRLTWHAKGYPIDTEFYAVDVSLSAANIAYTEDYIDTLLQRYSGKRMLFDMYGQAYFKD